MTPDEIKKTGEERLVRIHGLVLRGVELCKSQKSLAEKIGISLSSVQRIASQNWQDTSFKAFLKVEKYIEDIIENIDVLRVKGIAEVIRLERDLVRIPPFFEYLQRADRILEEWGTLAHDKQRKLWEEEIYPLVEVARAAHQEFLYFPILVLRLSGHAFLKALDMEQSHKILEYCRYAIALVETSWDSTKIDNSGDAFMQKRVHAGLCNNAAMYVEICSKQAFASRDLQHPAIIETKQLLEKTMNIYFCEYGARTALTIADEIRDIEWGKSIWQKIQNDIPEGIQEDLEDPVELKFFKERGIFG